MLNYLTTNWTNASVNLDVDSEIPLALLLMLRLDINPLHLGVEYLDIVELQARVGGRRAACYTVQIIHRTIALSESTCRSRVAHCVSFVDVEESPVETLSNIRQYKPPLRLHRTSTKIDARVSDAYVVYVCAAILTARVSTTSLRQQFFNENRVEIGVLLSFFFLSLLSKITNSIIKLCK